MLHLLSLELMNARLGGGIIFQILISAKCANPLPKRVFCWCSILDRRDYCVTNQCCYNLAGLDPFKVFNKEWRNGFWRRSLPDFSWPVPPGNIRAVWSFAKDFCNLYRNTHCDREMLPGQAAIFYWLSLIPIGHIWFASAVDRARVRGVATFRPLQPCKTLLWPKFSGRWLGRVWVENGKNAWT